MRSRRIALALLCCLAAAAPAAGEVFLSQKEALALAFPDATRVERKSTVLGEEQARTVEALAGVPLESKLVTLHAGYRGDELLDYALIDVHTVRTQPEAFLVVLSPDGRVTSPGGNRSTAFEGYHRRPRERFDLTGGLMIQPTLLFGATFAFLSAGIYFYVGHVLSHRRQTSSGAGMAWLMFVTWWYALALATFSGGLLGLLGAVGVISLPLFTTITIINLLTTCVALMGLMFYLLYLYTGKPGMIWAVGVFYFFYYGLVVYFVEASDPVGVTINRWNTSLEYQNIIRGPLYIIAFLLLLFPQILGSLAYFMLFFQVREKTQKYRIRGGGRADRLVGLVRRGRPAGSVRARRRVSPWTVRPRVRGAPLGLTTSARFEHVPAGRYYARVRAINRTGSSPPSAAVTVIVAGATAHRTR